MAEREQASGFNPKHRVIGAVILVVAAVIIVPLILNKREPPRTDANGSGPTKTVIAEVPLPGDATPTPTSPTNPVVTPGANAVQAPPVSATPAPALMKPSDKPVIAAPSPSTAKTPSTSAPKTIGGKGWYVQVGTFSNPKNAQALADKLKHKGLAAATETISVERNKVTRVRIGPYGTEAQARKAQSDIQRRVGINGIVRQVK